MVYLVCKGLRHDSYLAATIDILVLETGPITIHFNLVHVLYPVQDHIETYSQELSL